jgi:hypothetical protein
VEFVEQADHDSGRLRQLRIMNYKLPKAIKRDRGLCPVATRNFFALLASCYEASFPTFRIVFRPVRQSTA